VIWNQDFGVLQKNKFYKKLLSIIKKISKTLRWYFNHKKKTKGSGTTIERLSQS
jgi:hypothetical protein